MRLRLLRCGYVRTSQNSGPGCWPPCCDDCPTASTCSRVRPIMPAMSWGVLPMAFSWRICVACCAVTGCEAPVQAAAARRRSSVWSVAWRWAAGRRMVGHRLFQTVLVRVAGGDREAVDLRVGEASRLAWLGLAERDADGVTDAREVAHAGLLARRTKIRNRIALAVEDTNSVVVVALRVAQTGLQVDDDLRLWIAVRIEQWDSGLEVGLLLRLDSGDLA